MVLRYPGKVGSLKAFFRMTTRCINFLHRVPGWFLATVIGWGLAHGVTGAQGLGPDPSQIDKGLRGLPALPKEDPLPQPPSPHVDGKGQEYQFVFQGLTITGNQVLSTSALEEDWPYQVGDTVSVKDIYVLTRAMTQRYREAGYALSFALVPEQTIDEGQFTIHVVEGSISEVEIEGGEIPGQLLRGLSPLIESLISESPSTARTLERYPLLFNDIPGLSARAVLSPAGKEASSRMVLELNHDRHVFSAGYSNFLPESLNRHLLSLSMSHHSWITGVDTLKVDLNLSPNTNYYRNISLLYSTYVGVDGVNVGMSFNHTRVGIETATLGIQNISSNAQLFASYPVIKTRQHTLQVGVTGDISSSLSRNFGVQQSHDNLHEISTWFQNDWQSGTARGFVRGTAEYGKRLSGLQGSSRADASPSYITGDLIARYEHLLGTPWGGRLSIGFSGMGKGVLDSDSVLSSVECSYGGSSFGRAFDSGTLSGDECLMGRVELGWQGGITLKTLGFPSIMSNVYIYLDRGKVWRRGLVFIGERRTDRAASTGMGLRTVFPGGIYLETEVATQLSRTDRVLPEDRSRLLIQLNYNF